MLCHSVFSLRSPEALSFQDSDVAMEKFTTGSPDESRRTSGSRPRLPPRMTLLTLPAIDLSSLFRASWATDRLERATVHAGAHTSKTPPARQCLFYLCSRWKSRI